MTLEFYTNLAKELKLKVRKVFGLSPTFLEVTGKELVRRGEGGGGGGLLPSPILNRVYRTRK